MSIRSRLLLLVLLATLLPFALVASRFYLEREKGIDVAVARLSATASGLGAALDERVRGTAQLHYGLSRAGDLQTTDRQACSVFLAAVREAYPQYTGILTINPDGQLFCDSLATGRELDLRNRRYFIQASGMPSGVALEPVFGGLTGVAVLQIAWPVRGPDGTLRLVLLASLNLEKFVRDRATEGAEILLTGADGQVLAWSPEARAARKGTSIADHPLFAFAEANMHGAAGEVIGIEGQRQIWATAAAPALRAAGLHILVGQSRADLMAGANRRFLEDMIGLAIVATVLFLGVWLLAELAIRRQVVRIGRMARQLGSGNLQARVPPPYPRGELGGLMTTLNGMAQSLEEQRRAIDELHQRLRQSQKMEAVGQLTGGVAHDFNNLLTVIIGNTDILLDEVRNRPDLHEMVETTMIAAERGADLTRSLLAFARRQPLEPQSTDVNRLIRQMDELLRRAAGEFVGCRFVLADDLWSAIIDPAQLQTAILNLVLNARDAMPRGGNLTVETANERLDGTYVAGHDEVQPGDYVMVAVGDDGDGMTPETAAQAFEPFFTTKEVGKGTGLGLSMVYGFVKQSGGHVKIYSEVGHGTSVKLYLPRSDEPVAVEEPRSPAPAAAAGEMILAVEDSDMVRTHVAQELRGLGYTVLTARNGAEALEILHREAAIDLLFTDVVMPGGLSGPQLAAEAVRLRPAMKVLYTSGYTENAVIHHGRLDPGVHLLNKPYRRQDLAAKLRLVLGEERRTV